METFSEPGQLVPESFYVFSDGLDVHHFYVSSFLDFPHHFLFGLSKMLLDVPHDLLLEDAVVLLEFPEDLGGATLADHFEVFFPPDELVESIGQLIHAFVSGHVEFADGSEAGFLVLLLLHHRALSTLFLHVVL